MKFIPIIKEYYLNNGNSKIKLIYNPVNKTYNYALAWDGEYLELINENEMYLKNSSGRILVKYVVLK